VIRALELPMWGDSYHHTMIAQLIVDHGGLFDSWQPYAELQTLNYHFGFHSAVAVYAWVSGISLPLVTLWVGQIFNVLAVIALYPLGVRIGGNRWAGVGAVFVAGLLAPLPMVYTNWGRYTQLAGQIALPAAISATWAALELKKRDWRLLGLAWILLSGLALTHYRVLILAVLFIPAYFILHLNRKQLSDFISRSFLIGIGALLLFIPWLVHLVGGLLFTQLLTQLGRSADATPIAVQQYNSIGDLSYYLPLWLWLLLMLCVGAGLIRRDKSVAIVSIWWLFILFAANPQWFHLPGEGALSNYAIFITSYLPAGILIGAGIGWVTTRAHRRWSLALAGVALCMVGLWGARERLNDLHIAQSALATSADQRAAEWIRQNVPLGGRFLVNSFFAYGGGVIVGSDGGWWLPLLSGRQTTLPPINYASERGPRPDYREWINALPSAIQTQGVASAAVLGMLRDRGINYVYIGQQQGRVNYDGPDVLKPEQLLASPAFRAVYHQDRVWVFEINQPK
jgi:hypothetical protein